MIHCNAPWYALQLKRGGNIHPDSSYYEGYGNINKDDLRTIWYGPNATKLRQGFADGILPEGCKSCTLKEDAVGHSRRLRLIEHGIPEYDVNAEPDIRFLDIVVSNLCNLKCIMCDGRQSTAWHKDEQKLARLNPDPIYKRPLKEHMRFGRGGEAEWLKNLFKEPHFFRNLDTLSLKGGEPLLDPRTEEIMQFFIDQGIAQNVTLVFATSGAIHNEAIFKLFSKYKRVRIEVSIEATGGLFQYIRGGDHFTIDDLERNVGILSNLDNTEITFATLAMAYNVWELGNLRDWITMVRQPNHFAWFRNVVVEPTYLHPHIIPLHMRQAAMDAIQPNEAFDLYEAECGDTSFANAVATLRTDAYTEEERAENLKQFISYTRDLDTVRGTNVLDVVPQLREIFD